MERKILDMDPVEIKEIYRERAGEIEMTKKYNEQLEKIQLIREKLENMLFTETEKTTLRKLCEEYLKLSEIDSEQCFIYGYALAVRITSEAFLQDKKNTSE